MYTKAKEEEMTEKFPEWLVEVMKEVEQTVTNVLEVTDTIGQKGTFYHVKRKDGSCAVGIARLHKGEVEFYDYHKDPAIVLALAEYAMLVHLEEIEENLGED